MQGWRGGLRIDPRTLHSAGCAVDHGSRSSRAHDAARGPRRWGRPGHDTEPRRVNRGLIGALAAAVGTVALIAVAWFVAVSAAAPDAAPNTVVLAPHGAPPTVYAGPGDRAQISGLWRFKKDQQDVGFDKGYQAGRFSGVARARRRSCPTRRRSAGARASTSSAATSAGIARTSTCPSTGIYAIRFESVNHRARRLRRRQARAASTRASTCRSRCASQLTAGARHKLVVRADWRGPAAMKRDGWHRLWFNFGGINRGVSIRRIGAQRDQRPGDEHEAAPTAPPSSTSRSTCATTLDAARDRRQGRAAARRPARRLRVPGRAARRSRHGGPRRRRCASRTPTLWSPERAEPLGPRARGPGRVDLPRPRRPARDPHRGPRPAAQRPHDQAARRVLPRGRLRPRRRAAPGRPGPHRRPAQGDRRQRDALAAPARSRHCSSASTPPGSWSGRASGPTDAPGAWTSLGAKRVRAAKDRVRTTVRQTQLHPSIITWNLANEVAGGGHPDGQIPYIDEMARRAASAWTRAGPSRWTSGARTRRASRRGSTATST